MTTDKAWNDIATWIDSLTDEQRDRIVEAREWGVCGSPQSDPDGPRCLLQHVDWDAYWYGSLTLGRFGMLGLGVRFDVLCDRLGIDRVVRACKLRAGADVHTSAPVHTNVNRSLFVNREHA